MKPDLSRGAAPRRYRMRRRAELVDETRLRITQAAMRLHTTVGPSKASMSSVAEEAGVTRLTLYRHFPSMDELFGACMGHWRSLHPPPDPLAWTRIDDFDRRVRRALSELYRWYEANGEDLTVAVPPVLMVEPCRLTSFAALTHAPSSMYASVFNVTRWTPTPTPTPAVPAIESVAAIESSWYWLPAATRTD